MPSIAPPPASTRPAALGATQSSPAVPAAQIPSQPPQAAASPVSQTTQVSPGPATQPAGSAAVASASGAPAAAAKANGGKLDMDWDDDDEATHVFDKEARDSSQKIEAPLGGPESRSPERASMDQILSQPRPSQAPAAGAPPPPPSTLSGAFGALGQARESTNGHATSVPPPPPSLRGGPAASQSVRSAPPPPPASMRGPNPSTTTAPIPPPPPPGQTTTAPMHMPVRPQSVPPPAHAQGPHAPPVQGPHAPPVQQAPAPAQHVSHPPMPQMPPVSRAMEATAMVPRPQPSRAGLWVALLVGVMAAVGAAVFFLMPRTGTLAVNVADARGGAVSKLEVYVDGKKSCETAPCIVPNVSPGVHEVKVVAQGFETLAPKAVTIESGKSLSESFTLTAAKQAGGTGIKVSGNQSGVRLVVDGKEYGPLPQEIRDLTAGEHKVKLVGSDRYAPIEKTVSVAQDEIVDMGPMQLKVLKGKATIQLGTPGAKVYLVSGTNRKEVPQFPIAIDFDPNEKWQLEAKLAGYDDYSQPISFDDGQAEKTIVVTLSPKGTTAAATTPATVAHTTTTAPPTTTPATPKEPATTPAPTGKQPPAFLAGENKEPAATTPKEPKTAANPAPAAGEAFLNINSLPASTVVLDGKPLGPTPRLKVSVSPGAHTVMFVNAEQSLKKSITVNVAAGETKAAFAKLRD